ncbi:hypothetical protein COLO4_15249 [Corchorus olitorius]|uniref:Transmembrane protein n=1 Tax=Corchorus olitorius TaxID=93759 RepID=A0A1R3JNT1_9ROSI|nr:hypothetical protein COLO4_15249 [Corchorus olitorius]
MTRFCELETVPDGVSSALSPLSFNFFHSNFAFLVCLFVFFFVFCSGCYQMGKDEVTSQRCASGELFLPWFPLSFPTSYFTPLLHGFFSLPFQAFCVADLADTAKLRAFPSLIRDCHITVETFFTSFDFG